MVWLWIAALTLLLIVIVMMSFIHFKLMIKREKANDLIMVDLKGFFGLIHYRFNVPVINFKNIQDGLQFISENINQNENDVVADDKERITKNKIVRYYEDSKALLKNVFEYSEWLTDTLSHLRCTKLMWHTQIGIGDAPETAITTGIVWGLKTSLLGFVFRYIHLEDGHPDLAVNPLYNQTEFAVEVACNFKIRFGYAMMAGVLLLLRIMKIKGGIKKMQRLLSKTS